MALATRIRSMNNVFHQSCRLMSTQIYVGKLSPKTTEEELKETFERFGTITRSHIFSKPRGYGFVKFETEEEALKAIEGMKGKKLGYRGRGPEVNVQLCKNPTAEKSSTDTTHTELD